MNSCFESRVVTLQDILLLVESVVARMGRHLPAHVSTKDLASAARLAIAEAFAENSVPVEMEAARIFCEGRVRGAVLDELRRLDPLSRHARARVNRVRRATAALEQELGRAPSFDEVAEACDMDVGEVAAAEQICAAATVVSLDGADVQRVADESVACPAEMACSSDLADLVNAAVARLPPRQAHALRRYYFDDVTLEMIAAELGVSIPAVHRLRKAGEAALRADFAVLSAWRAVVEAKNGEASAVDC